MNSFYASPWLSEERPSSSIGLVTASLDFQQRKSTWIYSRTDKKLFSFILRSFDENKPHLLHNERNQIGKSRSIPQRLAPALHTFHQPWDLVVHKEVVRKNLP